jgi:hypothetical protein
MDNNYKSKYISTATTTVFGTKATGVLHSIVIGDYENIPKLILTTSDLLIFNTESSINKYLNEKNSYNIIVSASPDEYVREVAKKMGFHMGYGSRIERNGEYLHLMGINKLHFIQILADMFNKKFDFENFLVALEKGLILVDFDARTGHNHGTKFRMKPICLPDLYSEVKEV